MKTIIRKLVSDACKFKNYEMINFPNQDNVRLLLRDDYHLFYNLEKFNLQISISIEDEWVDYLMFPSLRMINSQNKIELIKLINYVNWFVSAFGHFYIDSYDDIAYKVRLPKYFIMEYTEKAGQEFFDVPIDFFRTIQIPLIMISEGTWNSNIAIKFTDEIFRKGYVNNEDYNI